MPNNLEVLRAIQAAAKEEQEETEAEVEADPIDEPGATNVQVLYDLNVSTLNPSPATQIQPAPAQQITTPTAYTCPGPQLAKIRLNAKLRKYQVAKAAGCSTNTITRVENGSTQNIWAYIRYARGLNKLLGTNYSLSVLES